MPKVGGRRKKARSNNAIEDELEKDLPKIFVVRKGEIPRQLQQVVMDLRKCYYPNTAMKLQDNSKIDLKTYLKSAKYYNVTHLVALQHNNLKNYLRIIKVGGGEMSFRIVNYCRMKDVLHHGGQPFSFAFKDPLVVLNGFGENSQIRMIGLSLQEMFPAINPQKLKVERLKRVISFSYNANKKFIYFRHYKIIVEEGGVNKYFSTLLHQKNLDLSKFKTIGEYLATLKNSNQEQQGEENKQKVKLVQIGPRFKLKFLYYKQKSGHVHDDGEAVTEFQNTQMGGNEEEEAQ